MTMKVTLLWLTLILSTAYSSSVAQVHPLSTRPTWITILPAADEYVYYRGDGTAPSARRSRQGLTRSGRPRWPTALARPDRTGPAYTARTNKSSCLRASSWAKVADLATEEKDDVGHLRPMVSSSFFCHEWKIKFCSGQG